MTFKTVPIQIVGQTYQHRSRPLSSQRTLNLIPEFNVTGKKESSLTNWPGSKSFTLEGGTDRGMHVFNNVAYKVTGNTLKKINSDKTVTDIGTILGANRCIFANDGTNMIITTGGAGYQYVDGTNTLTEITDSDFENGNSVAFLNSQMIFDGNGGRFQVANPGDPDNIESNNFATAESSPDDTIRVYTFGERLYLFGERTIETWYNSGTGNPPFDRVNGGTMQIGLAAVHSVTESRDFVYFLGSDKSVYRFSAAQAQSITPVAIAHEFESYSDVSDAIANMVQIEGQYFYILKFPTAGKTFAFNEASQGWFELSTGADQDNYILNSYVEAYGKKLIADNGNVLELDLDTYTDNGETIIRERVTAPLDGSAIGLEGGRVTMSRLQIIMETGTGLITGQGSIPQMTFEASYDGGKSWTNADTVEIGRLGESRTKVEWYNMASFLEVCFRIRVSDPVFISIHSASIDISAGGW